VNDVLDGVCVAQQAPALGMRAAQVTLAVHVEGRFAGPTLAKVFAGSHQRDRSLQQFAPGMVDPRLFCR
jgi:hypothetical protein